jgi:hypothetical protein
VEVDEARDGVTQNVHQAIAPVALDHLKGELRLGGWNLLPADLAYHTDSQGQSREYILELYSQTI